MTSLLHHQHITDESYGVTIQADVRVLLIERDAHIVDLLTDKLTSLGYRLDVAMTHEEGQRATETSAFQLVVIGYMGDEKQGSNLVQWLNQFPTPPAVLIMAEAGQESIVADAIRFGAGDYIIKDDEGNFWQLLPIVLRNIMSRRRLEKEKQDMLTALQERNRELASLNRIGNELTSILEPQQLVARLMRAAIDVLGVEGGSLWIWDTKLEDTLVCQAVIHRTSTPPLIGMHRRRGEGIAGWVAEKSRSTIMQRPDTDVRFSRDIDTRINFKTQSLMAVPLRVRDETMGVLEFVNKISGSFDEEDLSLAETLASSASTALENARLVETLRKQTEDLKERNDELDAFGHTVAHDLQNMLARVVGFAELLVMEFGSENPEYDQATLKNASAVIAKNSRKMSKVIESLLLFAAVRQADVQFEMVNMTEVVQEAVQRLDELINQSGAEVTISSEMDSAWGYAPWIEEVWFNYLANALKHGGEPPRISLGSKSLPESGELMFWVRDEGAGIDPEVQNRLFTPFTEVGRKRSSGHGLGLSIVERIVRKLNGRVGVNSQLGQGSCFWFTLPYRHQETLTLP